MRHDKRTHSAKGGSSSNQQPNRFSRQSKNSKVSNEEGAIDDDVTETHKEIDESHMSSSNDDRMLRDEIVSPPVAATPSNASDKCSQNNEDYSATVEPSQIDVQPSTASQRGRRQFLQTPELTQEEIELQQDQEEQLQLGAY